MSQPRKALTQHAAEIEQWMAQGWLTRQENGLRVLSIDRTSCSRGRHGSSSPGWNIASVTTSITGARTPIGQRVNESGVCRG